MITTSLLRDLPKTDLHVHLDGSLRERSVIELARERGVRLPADSVEGLNALVFKPAYASLDARARFGLASGAPPVPAAHPAPPANPCISGAILRGRATPPDCPAFGGACTPERPLGAPMVSSEGACAAYYRYRRHG